MAETVPSAQLRLLDKLDDIKQLADIIAKAERLRLMNPQGHEDFLNEMRWSQKEAEHTKDGIDIATVDLTPSERIGFHLSKRWEVISKLKDWKKGTAYEKLSRKTAEASAALGFIQMPHHTPSDFFDGGRALQRVWLAADDQQLAFQPQSSCTLLFAWLLHGKGALMEEEMKAELAVLREAFVRIFSIEDTIGELFVFRLCKSNRAVKRSIRRPVDDFFQNRAVCAEYTRI